MRSLLTVLLCSCAAATARDDGGVPMDAGATGTNEPAGLTLQSDRPFDRTVPSYGPSENGWWDNGIEITTDATAPKSPGSVGRISFPAGFGGGSSPASAEHHGLDLTTLYVKTWVKLSSGWQSHASGVNKILHLWINGANKLVITGAGYVADGPITARISLQGIVAGGNTEAGASGTYESTAELKRGQWHQLEVIAVANTAGRTDGSVKLFVDGALAASCSGIQFVGADGTWDMVQWSPTWGGTGDTLAAAQAMEMDHTRVSGR